jgi:hypothetical protein
MDGSTREEEARSVSERVSVGGALSQSRAAIHATGSWSRAIRDAIYRSGRQLHPRHSAMRD